MPTSPAAKPQPLISDDQTLVGATTRFGNKIPTYDDGFGKLWIHRNTMGILGIVNAQTEADAHEICQDEFYPEAHQTVEELRKEFGFTRQNVRVLNPDGSFKEWAHIDTPCTDPNGFRENHLFQEQYGERPSGPRAGFWDKEKTKRKDPIGHGIYTKDLNGESLEPLTQKLIDDLEIKLEITGPDVDVVEQDGSDPVPIAEDRNKSLEALAQARDHSLKAMAGPS
jgi:hypothetical protein